MAEYGEAAGTAERRGPWWRGRPLLWVLLAAALAMLVTGMVLHEAVLMSLGLVVAGVTASLLDPHGLRSRPPR
ncbi:hypothetical protein AB0L25_05390 [Spirillospora sp. NPDC052242]